MGAPRLKEVVKKKNNKTIEHKEQVKEFQGKLRELLKDKKTAQKAAHIIEQMLSEKK